MTRHLTACAAILVCACSASHGPKSSDRAHTWTFENDDFAPSLNDFVGPFCCTGDTLTIEADGAGNLGYLYAYVWNTVAFNDEQTSFVQDMRILLSGATDLADLDNQVMSWVRFRADRDGPGAVQRATVGLLRYEVTLNDVTTQRFNEVPYFDMSSTDFTVKVERLAQSATPDEPLNYGRCLAEPRAGHGRCLTLNPACDIDVGELCANATELAVTFGTYVESYAIELDTFTEECDGDGLFYDFNRTRLVLCPSLCERVAREATLLSIDC
jgi:hypothetical protein